MDVRTMQGRGAASGLGDLCTYGVQYFVLVIIVRDIDTDGVIRPSILTLRVFASMDESLYSYLNRLLRYSSIFFKSSTFFYEKSHNVGFGIQTDGVIFSYSVIFYMKRRLSKN